MTKATAAPEATFSLLKAPEAAEPKTPWEGDKLDRQAVANDFTLILKSINQPYVIALDAEYGMGKSFFIKHWIADLKNQGEACVYFNAWENDFAQEPLVPFVGNLIDELQTSGLFRKPNLTTLKEEFDKIVPKLTFRAGIDLSSFGVPINASVQAEKSTPKPHQWYDDYEEAKKAITNLKAALYEAILQLRRPEGGNPNANLYIFVDELERCKPTFAIELLEIMKHWFDVPGVVFVLATAQKQLESTIKHVYGQGLDGEGYLRRFFDLELQLATPRLNDFLHHLFFDQQILTAAEIQEYKTFLPAISLLIEEIGLTPRTLIKCFSFYLLCLPLLNEKSLGQQKWLLFILCVFYLSNRAIFMNSYANAAIPYLTKGADFQKEELNLKFEFAIKKDEGYFGNPHSIQQKVCAIILKMAGYSRVLD